MLLACALAVFGVSCMKVDEAADPVWGKEPCAHCRMLVGDRRYAAQVVSDGERRHFDDVGCLVLWLEERRGGPAPRVWVRDAEASRWVDARSARYEPGAKTPMDFGFEARSGGALAWDDMRARVLAKRRAP
jgi:copper chaperone NosL